MTAFFERIAEHPAVYDAARGADILNTLTKAFAAADELAPAANLLRASQDVRDFLAA